MGENKISDDGMSLVVDALQYKNTLTKLNVRRCGLSVKGTLVYNQFGQSSSCTVTFGQTRTD